MRSAAARGANSPRSSTIPSVLAWCGSAPEKGRETLGRFFTEALSEHQRRQVRPASGDMSRAYTEAIKHHCPNATLKAHFENILAFVEHDPTNTAAEGLDNAAIAPRLDTPRQIVSKWRKRFLRERPGALEERSRTGRPALFPPRASSSPLRPWPLSCRTGPRCRCRAGACRRSAAKSSSAAWSPRSDKPPCGVG